MKTRLKATAGAAALLLALASGHALADSSYGYKGDGSTAVTATATLKITVNTPKLIVLRVGAANSQTELNFNLTPSIAAAPSPVPATDGDSQAANWSGAAPTFAQNTVGAVSAYLWHNNSGNAELTCSATTPFTGALTAADVLVSAGAGLAHPGADTSCGATVTGLARNTVHTGSWTYSLNPATLSSATPGSDSEVVTYTATTL